MLYGVVDKFIYLLMSFFVISLKRNFKKTSIKVSQINLIFTKQFYNINFKLYILKFKFE